MNLQTFDFNLLRVLDALLRECSTVRAGQRIGLSQPAVSAALGRLREALGDPLLVRSGQSLQPTEFALSLAEPLRQLLEDTERLLSRPRFDPATASATFRIAAADIFTEMLLPDLMRRMQHEAPGVTLRYSDALNPVMLDDLRGGLLDLVLLPQRICPPWLDNETLFRSTSRVILRQDHPVLRDARLRPGDEMRLDTYLSLGHAAFRVEADVPDNEDRVLAGLGLKRKVVLTVPSYTAVWRAVAATDLSGVLPRRLAEVVADRAGLSVHPVPFPMPSVTICQVWHPRNSAAPGLTWFRGLVRDFLAPLDEGGEGHT